MNMMTSMSLLLKTITFVACVSLRSTFAHELRGSIFVEAIQSFNEPGALTATDEGETDAASIILRRCGADGATCSVNSDCCSHPQKYYCDEGKCILPQI
jgi:hypothetical protein